MKFLPKNSIVGFSINGNEKSYFETTTDKDAFIEKYGTYHWRGFDSFVYVNGRYEQYIIHFNMRDLV